jgi:hypothetical protein
VVTDVLLRIRQPESGKAEPELSIPSGKSLPSQEEEKDGIIAEVQFARVRKATPKTLQIATVPDDRLHMKAAVEVVIEQEGEFYIARCNDLSEFGYGESPTEAIEDLQLSLVELYWAFKADADKLGPRMAEIWKHLRKVIEER